MLIFFFRNFRNNRLQRQEIKRVSGTAITQIRKLLSLTNERKRRNDPKKDDHKCDQEQMVKYEFVVSIQSWFKRQLCKQQSSSKCETVADMKGVGMLHKQIDIQPSGMKCFRILERKRWRILIFDLNSTP